MIEILKFIKESDLLKRVERATSPIGLERKENSAEHSWSLALAAMLLVEEVDPSLDKLKVIEMLLVHDLVEIDAGDHFCFGNQDTEAIQRAEEESANRIFGLLPESKSTRLKALWSEFEKKETNESLFANALDRFVPTIQNYENAGGSWKKHQIAESQFLKRNALVEEKFPKLWQYSKRILEASIANGWILKDH